MIVFPAIDLIDGKCVRLYQGDFAQMTTFDGDPIDVAVQFKEQGAEWLHIVDLDGARSGRPVHLEFARRMIAATGLQTRYGGGLRRTEDVSAAFDAGVTQVALGTAALDTDLLGSLVTQWGDRIEVALDRKGEQVAVEGWQAMAGSAREWAQRATALGIRKFLVTDIARDGTLSGANSDLVAQTRADAGDDTIAITIAGGVTTPDDVRRLSRAGAAGAVIGRALYDGRASLPALLAAAHEEEAR